MWLIYCSIVPLVIERSKLYFTGMLRSTINKLKQERSITPKLLMLREGHDRTEQFDMFLIEEQDVDGTSIGNSMGFVSFLNSISYSVKEYMK